MMKKTGIIFLLGLTFLIINSCSVSREVPGKDRLKYSVHLGTGQGGITENTDISVVPGVRVPEEASVDAFSGATGIAFSSGIHVTRNLKSNSIETGLDYMYNYQVFNYIDAGNLYIGVRELKVSQVMVPLTYNIEILKEVFPGAQLRFKAGLLGQLNIVSADDTGMLPSWSLNRFSGGFTAGLSSAPIELKNGSRIGLDLNLYRGSQVYKDFYNQPWFEMPGSSFFYVGINYQF